MVDQYRGGARGDTEVGGDYGWGKKKERPKEGDLCGVPQEGQEAARGE